MLTAFYFLGTAFSYLFRSVSGQTWSGPGRFVSEKLTHFGAGKMKFPTLSKACWHLSMILIWHVGIFGECVGIFFLDDTSSRASSLSLV